MGFSKFSDEDPTDLTGIEESAAYKKMSAREKLSKFDPVRCISVMLCNFSNFTRVIVMKLYHLRFRSCFLRHTHFL
jgi:hypothetical protein